MRKIFHNMLVTGVKFMHEKKRVREKGNVGESADWHQLFEWRKCQWKWGKVLLLETRLSNWILFKFVPGRRKFILNSKLWKKLDFKWMYTYACARDKKNGWLSWKRTSMKKWWPLKSIECEKVKDWNTFKYYERNSIMYLGQDVQMIQTKLYT